MNKFQTVITEIGKVAKDINQSGLIILFNEDIKDFSRDFSFMHPSEDLLEDIVVGDEVLIDDEVFEITQVGSNANQGLKKEGHILFKLKKDESSGSANQIELDGECETFSLNLPNT